MRKKFAVRLAQFALGCALGLLPCGCASDDSTHTVASDALAASEVLAVVAHSAAADNQVDGVMANAAQPSYGIAESQGGEPVSFTGEGVTRR